ncbi:hypothetical protein [Calothrix sp. UHCC 0171]|uniref:hypothetical protein n=1 Tax=Calothrix sp. UHCC 0171 TaxID=3110245 RepID=UPI002B2020A0|nr:hypothetical protein [Calothrix sp. UHCC 0171]MEA5573156.1 hypothetical protein [Calothrix sp. UHCC 0171]
MNKKFILSLLSSSTIFTSFMSTLAIINPAYAMEQKLIHTQDNSTCITNPHGGHNFICIRDTDRSSNAKPITSTIVAEGKSDINVALLDFTEEESDAAIQLFGCDCPFCLNSLRQLRGTGNLVY